MRGGISIVHVRNARNSLLASGKKADVRAIHALTGGSYTTIQRYLKELEALDKGVFGEGGFVDDGLKACVGQLHDRLKDLYLAEVNSAHKAAADQVEQANDQAEKEKKARADVEKELAKSSAEVERLTAALAQAKDLVAAANIELAVKEQKLQDNAENLERQSKQIKALEQRLADRERQNLEVVAETARVNKETAKNHTEEILMLHQQRDRMQNDIIQLSRDNAAFVQRNGDMAKELSERDRRIEILSQDVKTLQNQVTDSAASAAAARGELEAIKTAMEQAKPKPKAPRRQQVKKATS